MIKNMSLSSVTQTDMLLHPEFLTNEQLLTVVKERHLKIPNIELMNRDQLLEVFNNFCVPHGQRKYRDVGRGKTHHKNRSSGEMEVDSLKPTSPHKHMKTWHTERIKPPPDSLSSHIKRIKISVDLNTNSIISKEDTCKRKIELPKETLNDGATPQKKLKKPITWP